MKKNIYFVQVSYGQADMICFPYAVGCLQAFSQSVKEIAQAYEFADILIKREPIEKAMERLTEPAVVGFSCYVWNFEYNLALAHAIKVKYPDCRIVFGGHHVSPDRCILDSCNDVDVVIYGEGEEPFADLLLAFDFHKELSEVPNISYRDKKNIITNRAMRYSRCDYPSPYTAGCFDKLIAEYGCQLFNAIVEFSRGCPFSCTYCDWGNLNRKVKLFPMQRIFSDLAWVAEHGIDCVLSADANFGLFERDEIIADELVRLHKSTGHIKMFQTSYSKNSNDRVFRITKKFNEYGMNKGATLSFQTLCDSVATNIKRDNISTDSLTQFLRLYNRAKIAAYTELILGLPGETFESFVSGIDILLDCGQHQAIYVHNCEWLPCSQMAENEYMRNYDIGTSRIPLNQSHREPDEDDSVQEYSYIVTSTNSMTKNDWIKMNLYSCIIQCFHHGGILQLFAIYLHFEKGLPYSEFYLSLMNYISDSSTGTCKKTFDEICEVLKGAAAEKNGLTFVNEKYGCVTWSPEEYLQLNVAENIEEVYNCLLPFLKGFGIDCDVFEQLLTYQFAVLRKPYAEPTDFECRYDFKAYYKDVFDGTEPHMDKTNVRYIVKPVYYALKEYAKYVVWYGKKDTKKIYTDEVVAQR